MNETFWGVFKDGELLPVKGVLAHGCYEDALAACPEGATVRAVQVTAEGEPHLLDVDAGRLLYTYRKAGVT